MIRNEFSQEQSSFYCPPFLCVSVGLLVGRQLDDQHAGLSVLKAILVVGRLWRALGVQHEDLGPKEDMLTIE